MTRIDVQTLVLAFEKRIEALEKNPPDKISTEVIINLLENAIDDEIKKHFIELIRRDILKSVKHQFSHMRDEFIKTTVCNLLSDEKLRNDIEKQLKENILKGLEVNRY